MQSILRFSVKMQAILCLAILLPCLASAQTTTDNPFHPGTTVGEVMTWYTALYGAALIVLTRVQAILFPKAGAVPSVALRYLIIAACVGGLFIALGFANAWSIVIGFVGSALAYDKVLQPLGFKTPKPQ